MKTLGARLALWYSLVSTLTLFGLLAVGFYLLDRHLIRGLDALNAAEFERVKSAKPEGQHLVGDVGHQAPGSQLFYFERVDRNGHVTFSSPNLGGQRLPEGGETFTANIPALGEMRVGRFTIGEAAVKIATPLAPVRKVMEGYAQVSLVLVCLVLLASLASGLMLSQIALRPLRLIQETADRIRSDNLGERIPVADVQDEISGLARLLNEMFDRLEASFQQVRRFAAEASHELKTPLSLVRLQAEKLLATSGLSAEQEEALQVQLEEVSCLNQIIEDLLFLSRAEARAIAMDRVEQDPRVFMESVTHDARLLAEHVGVRCETTIEGSGAVAFDPRWMRQVLLNLVTNAIRVSPRGGLLTLESEFTVDAWRVAVEDEGPGVPPEQRPRIFERFVRLAADEATATPGSGLGLAICRSILQMHHGSIRADAGTRKEGLRVICEIPLPAKAPAAPPPAAPAQPVAQGHID